MAANYLLIDQGLIKTKYNRPGITHNLIPRRRIVEKLNRALKYKLTIITAPAGYGKSTAILEWLGQVGFPVSWLSLDHADNDPVRFWRYVMAAVEASGAMGNDKSLAGTPVNKELIMSNFFMDMLIDKLYDIKGDTFLIFDDCHLIHNELVKRSMQYFIKNMPSNIRIILLSREELDTELPGMCAADQVLKVSGRELAFNSCEIAEFFRIRGFELTTEEASALEDYTEGWAAGLVVAAFTMEEGSDVQTAVRELSGRNRHIGSFMKNEVFDCWTDEVKEFLTHTAFLDRLSGPLCSRVTGNENSGELLRMLSESNSFILPLDHENRWFRYHHLFQEFLINRLEAVPASMKRSLYRLAGEWYLENSNIQDAINCFIKAGEYVKAFPLVWDIYLAMTQNGEYSTWRKWMEDMPEQLCESDVRACTGYSWVLAMEKRLDEAEIWADKAQACFDRIKDGLNKEDKDFLEANIAFTYANTAIFRMDAAEGVRHFKKVCNSNLYTPIVIGEMNSGESNLLNTAYGFKGRLNKVEEAYNSVLEELPRFLGDFSVYIAAALAECNYERNDLKAVYTTLVSNMGRITGLRNPGIIVPCFITLAKEKRAKGDIKGALKLIESGKSILAEKNKSIWSYFLDVFTAGLHIYMGDAQNASKWLKTDRISIFDSLSAIRESEYIIYARYLLLTGCFDEALLLLNRLEEFAQKEDRLRSLIEVLCLTAIAYQQRGDSSSAIFALHKALELGSGDGYVRIFIDEARPMEELLTKYKAWIKQTGESKYDKYVKQLLKLVKAYVKSLDTIPGPDNSASVNTGKGELLLSSRELEVLKLLVAEHSNQEIAQELFITVRTVKHHNSQIYEKMKVKNRLEAIIKARELGLAE